jgi:hypothetical protein
VSLEAVRAALRAKSSATTTTTTTTAWSIYGRRRDSSTLAQTEVEEYIPTAHCMKCVTDAAAKCLELCSRLLAEFNRFTTAHCVSRQGHEYARMPILGYGANDS